MDSREHRDHKQLTLELAEATMSSLTEKVMDAHQRGRKVQFHMPFGATFGRLDSDDCPAGSKITIEFLD